MYSLKNLWSQEPAAIAEAVRQFLIVGGLILAASDAKVTIPDGLILGIVSLVSIVLTLFTRNSVSSPATVASLTASSNAVLDALQAAQATGTALEQQVAQSIAASAQDTLAGQGGA